MFSLVLYVLVSLDRHRSAYNKLDSDNHILQLEKDSLSAQLQQLENEQTYSVDQVAALSNDNSQLYAQQESLTSKISQLEYDLMQSDWLRKSLSVENQTWHREREVLLNNQVTASRELASLQNTCNYLERDLLLSQENLKTLEISYAKEKSALAREIEGLRKASDAEKNKFIQSRISLKNKIENLDSQRKQLALSHETIAKENKALRSQKKKFDSRVKGTVGDTFDNHMDSLKMVQSSLVQHLISEKEGSHMFDCHCRIKPFCSAI